MKTFASLKSKEKFEIDGDFGLKISLFLSTVIILIYFMSACLIVFGLQNTSFLSWLELVEIVALFFVAVYAAREQLDVK